MSMRLAGVDSATSSTAPRRKPTAPRQRAEWQGEPSSYGRKVRSLVQYVDPPTLSQSNRHLGINVSRAILMESVSSVF